MAVDGQPYLIPIIYHFDGEAAYAFSLPGRKM
jgi:nitroimidazol reductase NimA-like FMN-containing flavoprotein (pyridoxamine 5'-phosphate oxidase superfamily)